MKNTKKEKRELIQKTKRYFERLLEERILLKDIIILECSYYDNESLDVYFENWFNHKEYKIDFKKDTIYRMN